MDKALPSAGWQILFEKLRQPAMILGVSGEVLAVNGGACKCLAYSREVLLGKTVFELDPGLTRERFCQSLREAPEVFETELQRGDGSPFLSEVALTPLSLNEERWVLAELRDTSERKRVDEPRQWSVQLCRTIFERMPVGYAHCRMLFEDGQPVDWIYLSVNAAFNRLTGLQGVEGKKVSEILPSLRSSSRDVFEVYGRVISSRVSESFETFVPALDRWLALDVLSLGSADFVAIFKDISAEMAGRDALRQSEEKWRSLYSFLPVGVSILDEQGRTKEFNQALGGILGFTPEGLRAGAYRQRTYLRPDGSPMPLEEFPSTRAVREQRSIGPVEIGVVKEGGEVVWTEVSAAPLPLPDSTCVIATVDVTARKLAAEALHRSERRFRALFEKNASAMLLIDPLSGEILDANPSAIAYYDYPSSRLVGMNISEINTLSPDRVAEERLKALHEERNFFDFTHRMASGEIRLVEVYSTPIDTEGHPLLLSIIHDVTQRKEAESKLKQALLEAQHLRDALNHVSAYIYMKDPQFRYVYGNRATLELFGCSATELVGSDSSRFFSEDTARRLQVIDTRVLQGEAISQEIDTHDEDGHRRVYWAVKSPIYSESDPKEIWGFLGISTDITDRKRLEEEVAESETRLRQAAEAAEFGVYAWDFVSKEVYYSPEFLRAYGLDSGQTLDLDADQVARVLHPEDKPLFLSSMIAANDPSGGGILNVEFRIVLGDNGIRWLRARGRTSFSDGKPVRANGILQDISEHKLMEEALRESEGKFRALFEHASIGITCAEAGGRIQFVNPTLARMLDYSPDEMIGLSLVDLTHPDHRDQALGLRNQLIAGSIDQVEMELQALRKGGQALWITLRACTVRDDEGRVRFVFGLMEDISRRRQTEEVRRQFEEKLNQMQKLEALGVLVSGVAHNLNNALAAIMATTSLRIRLGADPKDLEAYNTISKACVKGREVVKALTQFTQTSLAKSEPLELNGLVTEFRAFLKNTSRNRIEICQALAEEPLWIQGDSGAIRDALMHLCLNALEAMPQGGLLILRTAGLDAHWVEISVMDSGQGMEPEVLQRAMDPFFTTKPVGQGAGLGLSVTHGLLKAHGGTLELSSSVGEGTNAHLRFPRIPVPLMEVPHQMPAQPVGPLKVLLVDDDEDVRFLVGRMLKGAGLQVQSAPGGEEALEILGRNELPDLVILDQNMPRMDGIQTLEKIREQHPALPVLISSGQPDIENWECFKLPHVAVIPKPFEVEEILARLAQMDLKRFS